MSRFPLAVRRSVEEWSLWSRKTSGYSRRLCRKSHHQDYSLRTCYNPREIPYKSWTYKRALISKMQQREACLRRSIGQSVMSHPVTELQAELFRFALSNLSTTFRHAFSYSSSDSRLLVDQNRIVLSYIKP